MTSNNKSLRSTINELFNDSDFGYDPYISREQYSKLIDELKKIDSQWKRGTIEGVLHYLHTQDEAIRSTLLGDNTSNAGDYDKPSCLKTMVAIICEVLTMTKQVLASTFAHAHYRGSDPDMGGSMLNDLLLRQYNQAVSYVQKVATKYSDVNGHGTAMMCIQKIAETCRIRYIKNSFNVTSGPGISRAVDALRNADYIFSEIRRRYTEDVADFKKEGHTHFNYAVVCLTAAYIISIGITGVNICGDDLAYIMEGDASVFIDCARNCASHS